MGTNNSIKAAIYGRVSTSGHGQDVELQMEELRAVAKQRGWLVVSEYIDDGVSGSLENRPALDAMMADAKKGKLDLVVVWRLDRLGRSLGHLLRLLDELQHVGVGFLSVRDNGIDTVSPQGRLLLQLLGAFAEFERALIQERVQAGVRRAQANGVHCGRPKRDLDLRAAILLLEQGHSVKAVSGMLGLPRSTLVRKLQEGGHTVAQLGCPKVSNSEPALQGQ